MSAKKYKTVAAVLEATNDGRGISRDEVAARVLRANVWGVGAGQPGCLYDNGPNYSTSRRAAIADAVWHAGDDAPRGFAAELARNGSANAGGQRYEVYQATVADMF
jgi:hypothetical protein